MTESSDNLLRRRARESWFSRFQIVGLVVLTLLASASFDPQLIWETEELAQ